MYIIGKEQSINFNQMCRFTRNICLQLTVDGDIGLSGPIVTKSVTAAIIREQGYVTILYQPMEAVSAPPTAPKNPKHNHAIPIHAQVGNICQYSQHVEIRYCAPITAILS